MNKEFKIVDLTHSLSKEIPTWDGSCGFEIAISTDYKDCTLPDLFRTQKINCNCGIGTHIDAPAHCFSDAITVDNLEIDNLVSDCIVIDVSNIGDENYIITPDIIEKFEKEHGEIKKNSFVIFYTGWDKFWTTPEKYINNHKFPSIHEDTAKELLKRGIVGLGTDTLSSDTGSNGFPVHRAILGSRKYLVENIANAKDLPKTGAKILVLPMKIKDATEAPIRLIGLI